MSETTPTAAAGAALGLGADAGRLALLRSTIVLLARGDPVSVDQIAAAMGSSADTIREGLAATGGVEYDADGHVVGLGLTLRPTPHRFEVGGRTLYTWCALDALAFPRLLHAPARVESRCPASGRLVRLELLADQILLVDPPDAVVSIVARTGGEATGVRTSFCDHVSFFSSAEAAKPWLATHPGGAVLPVGEAYQLARGLTEGAYRA